jgi:hypothetical protein
LKKLEVGVEGLAKLLSVGVARKDLPALGHEADSDAGDAWSAQPIDAPSDKCDLAPGVRCEDDPLRDP